MPILGYFVVVGCTLLGLLFAADLYLPKKQQLSFASNLDGLPAAYKGDPKPLPAAAPHIAPLPAIAETTGSGSGMALASAESKPAPAVAAAPVVQHAAKPAKRKVVVRRQQRDQDDNFGAFGRQDFARQDYGRQNSGFGSREPSREPSWRDSWAQGQYQQREPRSRSASRSGNDFGNFGGGNFGFFR